MMQLCLSPSPLIHLIQAQVPELTIHVGPRAQERVGLSSELLTWAASPSAVWPWLRAGPASVKTTCPGDSTLPPSKDKLAGSLLCLHELIHHVIIFSALLFEL